MTFPYRSEGLGPERCSGTFKTFQMGYKWVICSQWSGTGGTWLLARLSTYVTNKSKVPNPQTANDRVFLPQSTVSLSPTRDSHTYFITCTLRACSHAPSQRLTVYYICDVHSASALATKCVGTKRVFPSVRVPLQPSHNPRYGHNAGAVSVRPNRVSSPFRRHRGTSHDDLHASLGSCIWASCRRCAIGAFCTLYPA